MNQEAIITILDQLGLKPTESKVYFAALEQGKSTALSLARATGIKRGTVYEIIDRLTDKGFLKTVQADTKRHFLAEDPKVISERLEEYSQQFKNSLPDLLAIASQGSTRPKVTFFEGEDEIWQIYEDTIKEGQPILSYTSVLDLYHLLEPRKIEHYIKRRTEKKLPIRIIAIDSPESRQWAMREEEELRETRLVPREMYNFAADVEIYGNKVAMVSFKKNLFGIIIESEQIAQMQKVVFELMWQGAKM